METLKETIQHLEMAVFQLSILHDSSELDRHERGDISSKIATLESMIETFKHYIEVGFVDY